MTKVEGRGKNNFMKLKVIVFDWDNTIVFSRELLYRGLEHALDHFGMDRSILQSQKFVENVHFSVRDAFPRIFGENWQKVNKVYNAFFEKHHLDFIKLIPGVEESIMQLVDNEVTLSIVSNKDGPYLRKEVRALGLEKYFYSIVGAFDTDKDKPSPIPVYHALNGKLTPEDFHPEKVWFVGDSRADVECSYNTNCFPIIFQGDDLAHRFAEEKKMQHAKVDSYEELMKLFSNRFVK